MESGLTLGFCRKRIGIEGSNLTDAEVLELRDFLVTLANVILDAFTDLEGIDQAQFNPPGDVIDQLNAIPKATK